MKNLFKTNKKVFILSIVAVLVVLSMFLSATFAYFQAVAGDNARKDIRIATDTTDSLVFSVDKNIAFSANQDNFGINGNNLSSDATAQAILTPNSKTGTASKN